MGKINQREKMKENWKKLAEVWAKYESPGRPSVGEIIFFEKEIKRLLNIDKNIRALVLGSTPEFRDLLAKYEIDTTIVDINADSIKAMTSLMQRKNKKEKIVVSDWLSMPFNINSFDLVLSDSAQDNIKYSEFGDFFEKIYSVLKDNGEWFFAAVNLAQNNRLSFNEYIDLYKKNPEKFKSFSYFLSHIFRLAYESEFYDEKNKEFDFYKVELKVKELVKNKELPEDSIKDLCIGLNYQQPVLSEEEFKNFINEKFSIISQFHDTTDPSMKLKLAVVLIK